MNKAGLAAFVSIALIVTLAHARAADGEVLINQAKVNAGGITPGDTAGFPATLSRPGRYKLSGNLVVPTGAIGIDVTANDVTIDFNGFTMLSDPSETAIGVRGLNDAGRLRVVNGTISGFGDIIVAGGTSGTVDNMRLLLGRLGVTVGTGWTIRNSTIAANSAFGISCTGCVVEGSIIAGNGSGVAVMDEPGLVRGNVIVGNNGFGSSFGLLSNAKTGYGANIIVGNNGGSINAQPDQLHPNVCDPACP